MLFYNGASHAGARAGVRAGARESGARPQRWGPPLAPRGSYPPGSAPLLPSPPPLVTAPFATAAAPPLLPLPPPLPGRAAGSGLRFSGRRWSMPRAGLGLTGLSSTPAAAAGAEGAAETAACWPLPLARRGAGGSARRAGAACCSGGASAGPPPAAPGAGGRGGETGARRVSRRRVCGPLACALSACMPAARRGAVRRGARCACARRRARPPAASHPPGAAHGRPAPSSGSSDRSSSPLAHTLKGRRSRQRPSARAQRSRSVSLEARGDGERCMLVACYGGVRGGTRGQAGGAARRRDGCTARWAASCAATGRVRGGAPWRGAALPLARGPRGPE
jgi:hypothetical protein